MDEVGRGDVDGGREAGLGDCSVVASEDGLEVSLLCVKKFPMLVMSAAR